MSDENTWSVSAQLNYLKLYVEHANKMLPQDKANAAKGLRNNIRNNNSYDIDGLMTGPDGNEQFMNETLREFLNTSDTGEPFSMKDMLGAGWSQATAASEHQTSAHPDHPNRKYTNDDGREAVFTYNGTNWVLSTNDRDKGTYNYAKSFNGLFDWTASSEHGRWDMDPYFRQFGYTPGYRSFFNNGPYLRRDYNVNGK
jgi:hypothetical protein